MFKKIIEDIGRMFTTEPVKKELPELCIYWGESVAHEEGLSCNSYNSKKWILFSAEKALCSEAFASSQARMNLLNCANMAQQSRHNKELDVLESNYFDTPITGGVFNKRAEFWHFVWAYGTRTIAMGFNSIQDPTQRTAQVRDNDTRLAVAARTMIANGIDKNSWVMAVKNHQSLEGFHFTVPLPPEVNIAEAAVNPERYQRLSYWANLI